MAKKKKKKKTSRRTRTTVPKTFVLRVSLQWIEPEVWRTIAVRGDTTLGRLHDVLQAVVGWRHTHLHHFFSGDKRISDPRFELDAFQDDDPVLDENDVLLSDIVSKKGDAFEYEYDFGDGWVHQISVLKTEPAGNHHPVWCLDGANACPPDDCGGPPGYEELKRAVADPAHPEHEGMLEWLGGSFDPSAFDRRAVNLELCRWILTRE